MNTYRIYGIPNCGSVKKALDFFKANDLDYEFINFKKDPITKELASQWLSQSDVNVIINKKGTSWRQLNDDIKCQELTEQSALQLILDNNSLVKRPVITLDSKIIQIGFDLDTYTESFT